MKTKTLKFRIIACDPGKKNGALVHLDTKNKVIYYGAMPPKLQGVVDFLRLVQTPKAARFYYEFLTYAQGGRRDSEGNFIRLSNPRSMGVLGENVGDLKGTATALGMKVVPVLPQRWQRTVGAYETGMTSSGIGYQKWKRHLKAIAQELFPQIRVTLVTADALLIALYAYRTEMEDNSLTLEDWKAILVKP